MTRKSLTELELATLGVMRDVCDAAIRRGMAEVGLRVRLSEGATRVQKMLNDFEREATT